MEKSAAHVPLELVDREDVGASPAATACGHEAALDDRLPHGAQCLEAKECGRFTRREQ
jgi:hypothetical protein